MNDETMVDWPSLLPALRFLAGQPDGEAADAAIAVIGRLRAENAKLKAENARLEARFCEVHATADIPRPEGSPSVPVCPCCEAVHEHDLRLVAEAAPAAAEVAMKENPE